MSSPLPPEGQAWPPQSEGFCLAPHSIGLGWPLARRPQELVLPRPPAAGKRQEAPTLCLRPVRAARNRSHPGPLEPGLYRRAFSWAPTVSARTLECIYYFMCCVFYSWIHLIFFTLSPHILL